MFKYRCTHASCRAKLRFVKPLESYRVPTIGVTATWLCARCGTGNLHNRDAAVKRQNRHRVVCGCGLVASQNAGPMPHFPGTHDDCEHSVHFNPFGGE